MNRTLLRVPLMAGLLVVSLMACAKAPASDSDRDALAAAIHRWTAAVDAQDVVTLTATMTDDDELLDEVAVVRGRAAAIRALIDTTHGKLGAVTREITIANDVAWHEVGLAQTQKNGDVRGAGLALEIWKREKGEWKLHRRMTTGVVEPG